MSLSVQDIELGFQSIQNHICDFLAKESHQPYLEDRWTYHKGEWTFDDTLLRKNTDM